MGWKEDLKRNLGTGGTQGDANQPLPEWKKKLKENLKGIIANKSAETTPTPIAQPDALTNARSLFAGNGFQVLGKTITPPPAPLKTSSDPFAILDRILSSSPSSNLTAGIKDNSKPLINTNISGSTPTFTQGSKTQRAAVAEMLGKTSIDPSQYLAEYSKLSPEAKGYVDAKQKEKTVEGIAQLATLPIRWTAGSLATAATSIALEYADSDLKYTPKTDAEKLLIGEYDIQRLANQDDLYGLAFKNGGIIPAIAIVAVLENPFLKSTGITKMIREGLERGIKTKMLSKLGPEGIIQIANDVINVEKKSKRLTQKEAAKALKQVNAVRITDQTVAKEGVGMVDNAAPIVEEPKLVFGGQEQLNKTPILTEPEVKPLDFNAPTVVDNTVDTGKIMQERIPQITSDTQLVKGPKEYKTVDEFIEAQGTPVYHGTNNDFKIFDKAKIGSATDEGMFGRGFYFANTEDFARIAPNGRGAKNIIEVYPAADLKIFNISDIKSKKEMADLLDMSEDALTQDANGLVRPLRGQSAQFSSKLQELGYDGAVVKRGGDAIETVIFEPNKIKTRAELTDIWNKANKENADKLPKGLKADKGTYSEEIVGKGKTEFKTMETPEQYRLAKQISPGLDFIMKNSKKFNGYFKPAKGQEVIAMNRKLYKRGKEETKEAYQNRISKTMAHEIGHLIDYLPDKEMNRGNLLGRLQVVSNFKQNFIAEPEILKQRQALMRKINEINKNDELLDSMQEKLTRPLLDELAALNKSITFNNPAFKEELVKLSRMWKPWEDGADEAYDAYRKSAAELYADFNSVLFNDPALAQEIAPRFYKEFFSSISKKPEVDRAFFEIQSELMGDTKTLMTKRYNMLKESGQNAQTRFAAMVAEREAKTKFPWKQSFLTQMWYKHSWVRNMDYKAQNLMENFDRGSYNKTVLFADKKIKPIFEKLDKAGLSSDDLDVVLKLERIGHDVTREGVANIKGFDTKTAQDVLAEMETILGKEKADALMSASKDLRETLKEVQMAYPDLFSKEQLDLMKSNEFYAPFNVLFDETTNIGFVIKQSTGNLDKDFNATLNTLIRTNSVLNYGEKNLIKKGIVDILLSDSKDAIKKADVSYLKLENEQLQRNVKKAPNGFEIVDIKREGKWESYYVREDIGNSLNNQTTQELFIGSKILRAVNQPFKAAYTLFNPGFQVVNFLFRDFAKSKLIWNPEVVRALQGKSNKGVANFIANNTYRLLYSRLMHLKDYKEALKLSREKNIYKKYSDITEEALKNNIIQIDRSGVINTIKPNTLTEIDEAAVRYVLSSSLGVTDARGPLNKWKNGINKIKDFSQSLEETPKLAAYIHLKRLGVLDEKSLVAIRNNVGSPNFYKAGTKSGDLSAFSLFYNPIIQGWANMGKEALIKDGAIAGSRAAFWSNKVRGAIIPALTMIAAEEGMFGEDIQRMVAYLPEYFKTGYITLPMGEDGSGNMRAITVPMSEDTRLIHGMVRVGVKTLLGSGNSETRNAALWNLASYTGGQIPLTQGLTPPIEIAKNWMGVYNSDSYNPYDPFRDQHLFTDTQMDLPKEEKMKILGKWTLSQNGIIKVNYRDSVNKQTIEQQTVGSTPILNRFYRVTNYGLYEPTKEVIKQGKEEAAVKLMEKNQSVINIVESIKKDPKYDYSNDIMKLAKERLGLEADDPKKLNAEVKNLVNSTQDVYIKSFGGPYLGTLMNQSNDIKQDILVDIYNNKRITNKDFADLVNRALSLKIISTEVATETFKELQLTK